MSNRSIRLPLLFAVLLIVVWASVLSGQSLADVARQQRQRAARESKPAKVYTNEDIQRSPAPTPATASPKPETQKAGAAEGQATSEGEEKKSETEAPQKGAAAKPGTPDKAAATQEAKEESPEKKRADLEKSYRERFAKLHETLAYEEKKLDVLQRELNLLQMQYYSDPNQALREQTFRGQINQRTQEIEQQKAAVEKAKQAIADLEEELRKKGLPAGWAR